MLLWFCYVDALLDIFAATAAVAAALIVNVATLTTETGRLRSEMERYDAESFSWFNSERYIKLNQ